MKSVKFNLDGDGNLEDNEKDDQLGNEATEDIKSLEKMPLLSNDKQDPLPYPKSVFFMFLTEFGERFSYYGMINILALFLRNILLYSENVATVIYHIFGMMAYTTPVIGSIFADSILGKYKTVVYFCVIHTIGSVLIAISAMPYLSLSLSKVLTIISLLIIAIGVGGIKPTISSFGGDQFKIPEQLSQLTMFFSIYYFSINIGSGLSTIFTPMLRKDVHCLGQDTCYSLAFGVPAGLILLALIVFYLGRKMYQVKPVTESVLVNTMKCIAYAIGNKQPDKKVEHWLDVAADKYSSSFIKDIKALFQIMIVFSPLPIFWALWTQMGSTWIFQASRMNGQISGNYTIKPDQTQFINPFLCLILIPFFETVVYPLFAKCNLLKKPLQRIGTGCFLLAVSFIMSGIVEVELQKSYPVLPTSLQNSYNIINALPCNLSLELDPVFTSNSDLKTTVNSFVNYTGTVDKYDNVFFDKIAAVDYNLTIHSESCFLNGKNISFVTKELLPQPGQVQTIIITKAKSSSEGTNIASQTREDLTKSLEGNAKLRIQAVNMVHSKFLVTLNSTGRNYSFQFSSTDGEILTSELEPNGYEIYFYETGKNHSDHGQIGIIDVQSGESSIILIATEFEHKRVWMKKFVLTEPNHIHMLWIIPQYVVQTLAEVFVVPTGYQFAYEQAPLSMKALVQSLWLLTTAGGHLIVVFVTTLNIFTDQAIEFFTFAGIMGIGMLVFIYLANEYKMLKQESSIMDPVRRRLSVVQSIATNVG